MPGRDLFVSQRNFRVMVSSVCIMVGGIPCALVRNCVMPPITICKMRHLASNVGCAFAHLSRFSLILSIVGVQGWD